MSTSTLSTHSTIDTFAAIWATRALSVFRIAVALLFIEHGTQKLFGFPIPPMGGQGPAAFSLIWYAAILEAVGGVLVLVGLFTRPVAFLLSGEMAVAYFMAHAPRGFFPAGNGGDGAVLFCFAFLYLAVAGAGPWSVDAAMGRSRLR